MIAAPEPEPEPEPPVPVAMPVPGAAAGETDSGVGSAPPRKLANSGAAALAAEALAKIADIDLDDIVMRILLGVDVRTLHRAQRVSRAWRACARTVFRGAEWRERQLLGCTWANDYGAFAATAWEEGRDVLGACTARATASGSGSYPPAGRNTTATVVATFTPGTVREVCLSVCGAGLLMLKDHISEG